MATYVAMDTVYPTIGEVVSFVALRTGLVSAIDSDPVYDRLKVFVREQKGKDFTELEKILDVMQDRLQGWLAPPRLGDIVFDVFRRFLDNYKTLILQGRASVFGRERFVAEHLVPKFFVPYAATLLKQLNMPPFDFIDVNRLLRSDAPLKVAFETPLQAMNKTWIDLAELYEGKHRNHSGRKSDHDIEDNRKLIRKWGAGSATPDLSTCLSLLDGLNWGQYSGMVFWVWIARFLQKIDKQHRLLIADAIQADVKVLRAEEFAVQVTQENDALGRMDLCSDAVIVLRQLTTLLFYATHRHLGDKARVEHLMMQADELAGKALHVRYYLTWLEARYWLYCRNFPKSLELYEKAFYEGMYGDPQAETMILQEWAAVAQKVNSKPALKRIDSRMKLLNMYPKLDADDVAELRRGDFRRNFGAEKHFIESF